MAAVRDLKVFEFTEIKAGKFSREDPSNLTETVQTKDLGDEGDIECGTFVVRETGGAVRRPKTGDTEFVGVATRDVNAGDAENDKYSINDIGAVALAGYMSVKVDLANKPTAITDVLRISLLTATAGYVTTNVTVNESIVISNARITKIGTNVMEVWLPGEATYS